jgi:hypothetical protein
MRAVLALLLSAATSLAGLSIRVGVVSSGSPPSSALIAKQIAKLEGIEVVHGQSPFKPDQKLSDADRKALGVSLHVQLLILVDPSGDAFAYVDASTGEELFRIREKSPETLADSAFLLVEELRDAEKATPSPTTSPDPTKPQAR